jgi:DNA primase
MRRPLFAVYARKRYSTERYCSSEFTDMAPYIDFAYVKAHADFPAILAHYGVTPPGASQKSFKVPCLFHDDDHPSLSINLAKQVFHCFGCGAEGDVIEFVRLAEHLEGDARRAAARVAELSGSALAAREERHKKHGENAPKRPREAREGTRTRKPPSPAPKAATRPPEAPEAPVNPPLRFRLTLEPDHPYLRARGFPRDLARTYGLGLASRGLLAGRIAIPIHSDTGELVAYAGRFPGESGWPEGEDKYKLPDGFKKSHVLFNLSRVLARGAPRHLVLVEGYFAALWLDQLGYDAVALMGARISPEQLGLLAQAAPERITVLLDGDAPGREAAGELVPLLTRSFFVRDAALAPDEEPDRLDPARLRSLLAR